MERFYWRGFSSSNLSTESWGTKTRSVVESSEGLEKESSETIKSTIAKNDLVQSLLGDGEKQETFDGHPRPDDGRDVLPTWRTPAIDATRPDAMHGVASDWSLLLYSVQRGVSSKTQSYDDTIDLRNQIYPWITKVAAVLAAGRPSERIFKYRHEATRAPGLKDIVPYQCRHSGASLDKAGRTTRTILEIKKRRRWKSDNSVAQNEKSGRLAQIQSDLNKSQLTYVEATDLALE